MIFLYNVLLIVLLILASPFILLKSLGSERLHYRIRDRFFPSKTVNNANYMLFHASSFGEMKALLNITDIFEGSFKKKSVFSVFTDTGYKIAESRNTLIMPIDFYPAYKRIFKSLPDAAFFFETEIWPSYITFLSRSNVKLILINARMSDKSFKMYRIFSFFFRGIIGKFDLVIAKSKQDAERFSTFNDNVVECGNIKQFKTSKSIAEKDILRIKNRFFLELDRPILTFGSMHKEEIEFAYNAASKLKNDLLIVIAPRHTEDAQAFCSYMKKNNLDVTKRSEHRISGGILLLDSMGELEDIYKISDAVFIGGSTKSFLHGHNPIEPLVYNKFVISGMYMDSFTNEIRELVDKGLIRQIDSADRLIEIVQDYFANPFKIDTGNYFNNLSYILNCYIKYINRYLD